MPKTKIIMDSQILTTLQSCPRLADFRFNQNLRPKGGKSNALECGSLVHTILEWRNKALISGKSNADAIAIGFEAGHEYIKGYSPINNFVKDPEDIGMKNTPENNDKYHTGWRHVLNTMEQYFDHYRNISYTLVAAEEVRQQVIYEDDDIVVLWKAKFDAILDMNNGFVSCDYKTMKQRRETASNNNQFMGQCVLVQSSQVMIDKIGFQTSLKPEEKFERVLIPYSADRLAEWRFEIVPHYANMLVAYNSVNHYPPNFTHCENKYGFCEFHRENLGNICGTDRNLRETAINLYFDKVKPWDVTND